MLAVRRRHESFAVGTFRELGVTDPSVLAYVREYKDDVVLCVNNLSRFPQPIELNLNNWSGYGVAHAAPDQRAAVRRPPPWFLGPASASS